MISLDLTDCESKSRFGWHCSLRSKTWLFPSALLEPPSSDVVNCIRRLRHRPIHSCRSNVGLVGPPSSKAVDSSLIPISRLSPTQAFFRWLASSIHDPQGQNLLC